MSDLIISRKKYNLDLEGIPVEFFVENDHLFDYLSPLEQVKVMMKPNTDYRLKKWNIVDAKIKLLYLYNIQKENLNNEIDISQDELEMILEYITKVWGDEENTYYNQDRLILLVKEIINKIDDKNIVIRELESIPVDIAEKIINNINEFTIKQYLFKLLYPLEKVKIMINSNVSFKLKKWKEIDLKTKVLYLYTLEEEKLENNIDISKDEFEEILKYIGKILLKLEPYLDYKQDKLILLFAQIINQVRDKEIIIKSIRSIPNNLMQSICNYVDKSIKKDYIFEFLQPIEKVDIMINSNKSYQLSKWDEIDLDTKIIYLYAISKNNLDINILKGKKQENPILKFIMNAIWSKDKNQKDKNKVFEYIHNKLEEYVVDISWDLENDLDMSYFLPKCSDDNISVVYCEGKPWKKSMNNKTDKNEYDLVFCPRKKGRCGENILETEARIMANINLDLDKWTGLEILENSNLKPKLDDLYEPEQYINKICGWINRLIEIRERLKCTKCKNTLISDKKYSKSLAVYNSTVFYCECGDEENQNVYISHCWACREIIDSRINKFRYDGLCLCLHCGSGRQNPTNYTQGDICPKCGSRNMRSEDIRNKNYICYDCSHRIMLPPEHKITGNKFR